MGNHFIHLYIGLAFDNFFSERGSLGPIITRHGAYLDLICLNKANLLQDLHYCQVYF